MIIKNIKLSGFERLYEGYRQCSKEHYTGFGEDFLNFLNHNMIGIRLAEISSIELFYLRQISSSIKVLDMKYSPIENESDEVKEYSKNLLSINSNIKNDEDISSYREDPDNILPIGCCLYEVLAVFKGAKITSVTGPLLNDLFKDDNDKISSEYIGNAELESKISALFLKNFYSFMASQMIKYDLVTNYLINKKFYQYADDICNLAYINSPFGEINLFGTNTDTLNKQVKLLIENLHKIGYDCTDKIYFTFIIKSSMKTFLDYFIDTDFIIDFEPLSLVYRKNSIKILANIEEKYSTRIDELISKLNSYKKNILETSQNIKLNEYNLICFGNEIIYSLQIPYNKLQEFIQKDIFIVNYEKSDIEKKIWDSTRPFIKFFS